MKKRVAIIGSGASGLTAIKCCLDEGLDPVCFEMTGHLGGLWYFTDEVREGQGCVMRSTVINTSKEMMSYSDFPAPREFAPYMHNSCVLRYLQMYAEEFGLQRHIRFGTEVVGAERAWHFSDTGQWKVSTRSRPPLSAGLTEEQLFDGLLVCTGHHAVPYTPELPGLGTFTGSVLHAHSLRDCDGYRGKRVLVVGIGNSGGDAAVGLGHTASKVFLSTRRGTWVLNRVADHGLPLDMVYSKRYLNAAAEHFSSLLNPLIESRLNKRFDHSMYSLKPEHKFTAQHPMVNDDLPNRIISGTVVIKPDVKHFTENGVEFVDGTCEDDIDVVLLATGYTIGFPFLDKAVIDVRENKIELYKYMFPPDLEKHTLAVIGCIQPLGAINPISEMQCRLATKVFKGELSLPACQSMWEDIGKKADEMKLRYVGTRRHTIQVTFISYMDELAAMVGCKPDILKLFCSDPKLALNCLFGPCTPYQYRLMGPGKWEGAKGAIEQQWERTLYPLKAKTSDQPERVSLFKWQYLVWVFFWIALAVAVGKYW